MGTFSQVHTGRNFDFLGIFHLIFLHIFHVVGKTFFIEYIGSVFSFYHKFTAVEIPCVTLFHIDIHFAVLFGEFIFIFEEKYIRFGIRRFDVAHEEVEKFTVGKHLFILVIEVLGNQFGQHLFVIGLGEHVDIFFDELIATLSVVIPLGHGFDVVTRESRYGAFHKFFGVARADDFVNDLFGFGVDENQCRIGVYSQFRFLSDAVGSFHVEF